MNIDNKHTATIMTIGEIDSSESPIPSGLSFEEALRQMRERRYSTFQRPRPSEPEDSTSSDGGVPTMVALSETSSLASAMEEESYWKRLSDRRRDASDHSPLPSRSTAEHTMSGFTDGLMAKLEGLVMDMNGNSSHHTSSMMSQSYHSGSSRRRATHFGKYEQQARELHYSRQDLHQLVDGQEFQKLQRSLRRKGAVTNEVLRQCLPLVVKQSKLNYEKQRLREHSAALARQSTI